MYASLVSAVNTIAPGAAGLSTPQSSPAPAFSGLLKDALHSVQTLEDQASSTVEGLMTGSGVDIHQAMIATQKASLAFEMALAIRNKAVAAYQQVMQTQF
ncbi:MAG TPA: flagellar hook-basal body complex protein FliE [Silvibacterium sp.]|nr:flagellar hook-basal body complex protein FliE [Silvibacterium sp.]